MNFERGITIDEVAAIAGVHRNTILRWIRVGARGVKLRAWRMGAKWFTSEDCLADFRRACTGPSHALEGFRSAAQATREKREAEERMMKRGFRRKNPPQTNGEAK